MRPLLVLGTLATLLVLGGSLPPKDKDKDGYNHDGDYGSDNDYGKGKGNGHDGGKSNSKSGFHIGDYNPFNLFTRQASPGCDDYSAGLCGCFCHYQGYPYYICAEDRCQCYREYITGCWYAYYYYVAGGYPAPNDWQYPVYPHCPRYPYCSNQPYSSETPTTYTPSSPTGDTSSPSGSPSTTTTPVITTPASEYTSSPSVSPSSTPYTSSPSSEYLSSTTTYVTSSEYYSSAEYTSTVVQNSSPSSS